MEHGLEHFCIVIDRARRRMGFNCQLARVFIFFAVNHWENRPRRVFSVRDVHGQLIMGKNDFWEKRYTWRTITKRRPKNP